MMTDPELLRERAASMGGPHHLSRPRLATLPTLFDTVECLAVVLTSEEARLKTRDGLDPHPDRIGRVRSVTGIRLTHPKPQLDLDGNFAWTVLDTLIGSLLDSESRVARLVGVAADRPDGPDALVVMGDELAAGTIVRDPVRFEAAVGELVKRTIEVYSSLDRPYVPA
jgi:hypothetical protein